MPFSVPAFNLTCDIWAGPWTSKVLRTAGVPCNLAFGKRVNMAFLDYPNDSGFQGFTQLLIPALTDVRANPTYPVADLVEVPSSSGRWYRAMWVEDIGKGFLNEHRFAALAQVSSSVDPIVYSGLAWPVPMP